LNPPLFIYHSRAADQAFLRHHGTGTTNAMNPRQARDRNSVGSGESPATDEEGQAKAGGYNDRR
jgi:hypothetical protein